MPPKKTGNVAADGVDGTAAGAVTALCHMIMSCDEFKADNTKLAPPVSFWPRKINSIVNPYGFKFKDGKMISQSKAQDGAAGPSDDTSAAEEGKDDKMKKATKAPKPHAKARQGPAKKRKLAVSFPDEDDSDHVKEEDGEEV
ncbi:hypothetical protein INS49_001156 [Diaporthe citri]|uniref:uncharacterized protein n=1 Tax=Diaporthe citri TaxID=83186 RepID=UPI001C827497|nr:uncharacterized protein INS49_001156 [Diaporthe citri]KAG6366975.1 hypothetical protein INS49_001156 [Diaporthe citri]